MRTLSRTIVVVALGVALLGASARVAAEDPSFERILVQGYTCALDNVDDGTGTGTFVPGVILNGSVIREWSVPSGGAWTYEFSTVSPFSRYLAGIRLTYGTVGLTGSMQHTVQYRVPGLTYPAVFRYTGEVVDATGTPVYRQTFEVTCTADGPAIVGSLHEDFGVTEVPAAEVPATAPTAPAPAPVPVPPRATG